MKSISGVSRGRGEKKSHSFGLVIFSLILLFNPNINLIDPLPDFIAYFILAKVFLRAADSAPYFEEARVGFIRLGFINLAKLPALFLVFTVRSGNTLDYDVVALTSFIFTVLELIFVVPTVKNVFSALFYLGQRSDADSLIAGTGSVSAEAISVFTQVFFIIKCALYTLPELLRLSKSVDGGAYIQSGSRFYSPALVSALLIGTVLGVIWLIRIISYVRRIAREGKFDFALSLLADSGAVGEFDKKQKYRKRNTAFLLIILSAFFSFDLIFDNFKGVNLIPATVFGVLFTLGAYKLSRLTKCREMWKKTILFGGISYIAVATVSYAFEFKFLLDYGYEALLYNEYPTAHKLYSLLRVTTAIETALIILISIGFFFAMQSFSRKNLGLSPESPRYGRLDKEYHKSVDIKTAILSSIIGLSGVAHAADIYVKGAAKIIFTNPDDVSMPVVISSALPWFGLVVTAVNLALVFYSVYYFNYIKEEMKL